MANNPYYSTYNPGWWNNPNFSYRNNDPTPNPYGQAVFESSFSNFQQSQKSNLEIMMENFINCQSKQNDEFRQHMKDSNDAIGQLSAKIDNLISHNKMIEIQISQLAGSSTRVQGRFAGNPELNPVEHCNAIILRSGEELQEKENTRYESSQEEGVVSEENEGFSKKHTLPMPLGTGMFSQDEKIEFVLPNTTEHPFGQDVCYRMDCSFQRKDEKDSSQMKDRDLIDNDATIPSIVLDVEDPGFEPPKDRKGSHGKYDPG